MVTASMKLKNACSLEESYDKLGQHIKKDPDAGKDWRQEEKGMAQDEMVGWHQQLNGHEFE